MIVIKHGNAKGTGSMLRIDAHPCGQYCNGYLSMRFFAQKKQDTSSDSGHISTDFESKGIAARLYFEDIAKLMEVFRGYTESIDDGKGIYIKYDDGSVVNIKLRHSFEPFCGYVLSITKKKSSTDKEQTVTICLTQSEALGLSLAIENVMGRIAFWI